jgi:hypothetical protein
VWKSYLYLKWTQQEELAGEGRIIIRMKIIKEEEGEKEAKEERYATRS